MSEPPAELFVTFEDGVHVGVFQDKTAAERLNAVRREKKGVEPVTVAYLPESQFLLLVDLWREDRVTTKGERNAALKERDAAVLAFEALRAEADQTAELLRVANEKIQMYADELRVIRERSETT